MQMSPTIFNTTGFPVEVKAAGQRYIFEPFESKEIYHQDHVVHIRDTFKYKGLVHLDYNEREQGIYETFNDFKTAKELEGLKDALKFKEQVLRDEKQASIEMMRQRGASTSDKDNLQVEKFEKEVRLISSWIKDAGGSVTRKAVQENVVAKRPDWRGKDVKDDSTKLAANKN